MITAFLRPLEAQTSDRDADRTPNPIRTRSNREKRGEIVSERESRMTSDRVFQHNRPGAVLRHRGRIASPARPLVRQRGVREHVQIKNYTDIGGDLMDMGRSCTDIGELNRHACRSIQS